MPVKTIFLVFLGFFTGGKCFSRTLFSVSFTPTFFFHGHSFYIFSRVEDFVSRGEFRFFFTGWGLFFSRAPFLFCILIKIVISIKTDIFLKHNYEFFHAHYLHFHGHIVLNFSRTQNFVSRTEIQENFHGQFFFFHGHFF